MEWRKNSECPASRNRRLSPRGARRLPHRRRFAFRLVARQRVPRDHGAKSGQRGLLGGASAMLWPPRSRPSAGFVGSGTKFCQKRKQISANQRTPLVCIILFLLVARRMAVSEAPGTILCQGFLQKIVPSVDVLSSFVPFRKESVSRCLARCGLRSRRHAPSGRRVHPRAITVRS